MRKHDDTDSPLGGRHDAPKKRSTERGLGNASAEVSAAVRFARGENDSVDELVQRIVKRRPRVPVSFEPGRAEHAEARLPSKGHDTLPIELPVVVNLTTDPARRTLS